MHAPDIQPVLNEPALFVQDKNLLIVADLHIGIESELRELGIQAPSQTAAMTKRLIALIKQFKSKTIVLLGDVKHNIPSSTIQERIDVKRFLDTIQSYGNIHIIPGNHDGFIYKLVPKSICIHPSDGYAMEDLGLCHGHRWPNEAVMRCETIIIGHTHPTIMLTDRLGYKTFEPCWLRGAFLKTPLQQKYPTASDPHIIVLPAFNHLCGGVAANTDPLVGPLGKIVDIGNMQVFLLDGASLGKVKHIH